MENLTGGKLRMGDRHLVVRLEHEEKFRAVVRILGFGLANCAND